MRFHIETVRLIQTATMLIQEQRLDTSRLIPSPLALGFSNTCPIHHPTVVALSCYTRHLSTLYRPRFAHIRILRMRL